MLLGLHSVCTELEAIYPHAYWKVTECINPLDYGASKEDFVKFCIGESVAVECDTSQWVVMMPRTYEIVYDIPRGILSTYSKDVKLPKVLQGVVCEWILTGGQKDTHPVGSLANLERMTAVLGI